MKTTHRYLPFVQALLLGATLSACADESPEEPERTQTETGPSVERTAQTDRAAATDEGAPAGAAKPDETASVPDETAAADPPKGGHHDSQAGAAGAAGAIAAAGAAGAAGGPFSSGPIVPPELPASFA